MTLVPPALEVRAVGWDDPAGAALREAQRAELTELYAGDLEPGPKPTGDDIAVFLVALDGGTAVGCGALRAVDTEHGELKRMYVVPERRGTGVADALLAALESAARERGWSRLVLETGEAQVAAIRLYERSGYVPIPRFGYYADSEISLCFAKRL